VVIDRNEQRVEKASNAGMLAFSADATHDESLREAGIPGAKGLIAALTSDVDNLFIILSAKTLNPAESGEKLRRAGADTVLTPFAMAGRQLADVLLRPHVRIHGLRQKQYRSRSHHEQVCVTPKGEFTRKTFGQLLELRKSGVIVFAIRKPGGDTTFNPPPEFEVSAGDFLIVMGERANLQRLERILTI
jgi:voltage-gated potassium channel